MNKTGPIVIIEDDVDDRYLLELAFAELECPNELRFFENGQEALDYLSDDNIYPFIILSDINLPRLGGPELINMVRTNERLSHRCIPFLFFSTHIDRRMASDVFYSSHGIFIKANDFLQLVAMLKKILNYWTE